MGRKRPANILAILSEYNLPATFPLSPHVTKGSLPRWYKVIRGKRYYFGPLDDPGGARILYDHERPYRERGMTPPPLPGSTRSDVLTLGDLANKWLSAIEAKPKIERVKPATFASYKRTMAAMLDVLGRDIPITALVPADFDKLRGRLIDSCDSVVTANKHLTIVRMVFKYAYSQGLIEHPMAMGAFNNVAKKQKQLRQHSLGRQVFEAGEVWAMIDATREGVTDAGRLGFRPSAHLEAFAWLAINGGMTQGDISELRGRDIDLSHGRIDTLRGKTAAVRRTPLWPETLDAINRSIEAQGREIGDDDRVFLTTRGNPWVIEQGTNHARNDALGKQFSKVLKACDIDLKLAGFGHLKHTHATVSGGSSDAEAAKIVRGHTYGDAVEEAYVRAANISWDRLEAVTAHVKNWLDAGKKGGVLAKIG